MKQIYIWGTGCEAEKCIANINFDNCMIMGYIETKPNKDIWRDKPVYKAECLPKIVYDYIVIATIYYKEIIDDVKKRKLADEKKIISWIAIRECIYNCEKEVWKLFTDEFLQSNFYFFSGEKRSRQRELYLQSYKKLYVYDVRLINCELDINILIREIIVNLKDEGIGMVFIPNEHYLDQHWYHNLLYILDRYAFVVWKELEDAYAEYIQNNAMQFSFEKFNLLQFVIQQKRVCHKSKYMFLEPRLVFEEKRVLINNASKVNIYLLRSDRIGEQIRQLNQLMRQGMEEQDIFNLYIPISEYGRPFEGVNVFFNEVISRNFNLLKNREEYCLWLKDIFENKDKYQYCGPIRLINYGNGVNIKIQHPTIGFDEYELELGRKLIRREIGITGRYVCLFTRDARFLKSIAPDRGSKHFKHHDFRDASFNIMNKAIDYFDDCGIQTIRMGQTAEAISVYGKCIDFVNQGYDEFLDLMVHYYSKFFIGSVAGITMLPTFFDRPVVNMISYYPCIEHNVDGKKEDLCIFNRLYSLDEKRELSFEEIFSNSYKLVTEGGCRGEYFEQQNLKIIPFTQEDVLEVAKEMNERLDGVWKDSDSDIAVSNLFNQKLKRSIEKNNIEVSELWMPTVATSYLRKYKYLLED